MSTFSGQIVEIPGISVDCFINDNLKSSVFFLSHCHTDHMKGLNVSFFDYLDEHDKYLYCSQISKLFLLGMFPRLRENRIRELENSIPKLIKYTIINNGQYELTSLTVTISPAGHCPGSVMFVFNKEEKTILYSGDFRINPEDLPKLNPLNNKFNGKNYPIKFNVVYLDTTFLNPDFPQLPSRKESCDEICKAIENWLESHIKNVVIIEASALYGVEYLYMEIFKLLKTKIHVKEKVYLNYKRISELSQCITSNASNARIHACTPKIWKKDHLVCRPDVTPENILTIVPSVQRWKCRNLLKIAEYDSVIQRRLYVCYSTHCSYEELKGFVDYFKPDKIFPCVCPSESASKIYQLIDELMYYRQKSPLESDSDDFKLTVPVVKIPEQSFKSKYFNDDDDNS